MPITDPWDERSIYLHEWLKMLKFVVNVGQYASPMDPMGHRKFFLRIVKINMQYFGGKEKL